MTSDQEIADFRAHEREVLARMGISETLAARPVSMKEFTVAMSDAIEAMRTLAARVDAIEQTDQYRGTFQRAVSYRKGMQVTHAGGLWIAVDDAPRGVVPGMSSVWQLASKGAKPAKADR